MARNERHIPRAVAPVKTLTVRSTTHTGGLTPNQTAVVDDTPQSRRFITSGMWILLVEPEVLTGTDNLADTFGDDLAPGAEPAAADEVIADEI